MAKLNKRLCFLLLSLLFFASSDPPLIRAEVKEYWHFTLKANINGTAAEEWIWATMVEMPREKAFPDEAKVAKDAKGQMYGFVLAQVRAAAYRSAYTYYIDTKCKSKPSRSEHSYSQSETDNVFVHGQIIHNPMDRRPSGIGLEYRFGVCNDKVLMEDGRWLRLDEMPQLLVGPIHVEGRAPEEMRGDFHVTGITYNDRILKVKRCDKSWIEEFHSVFDHLRRNNIVDGFEYGTTSMWMQHTWDFHSLKVQCVYMVERSREREHPYWKQRITHTP